MILQYHDYNSADQIFAEQLSDLWPELELILTEMPLHVKASDQANIRGTPIFDPVGTNHYIKENLQDQFNWSANYPVPEEFRFLGTDIDFCKSGAIAEVQFSNYPFLLNNVVRSELFFQSKVSFEDWETKVVVIITKAWMFPASNSTLYYEQAEKQLSALAKFNVFDVPIRLVGLFEEQDSEISAIWTEYTGRYSRTVRERNESRCMIRPGQGRRRSTITIF